MDFSIYIKFIVQAMLLVGKARGSSQGSNPGQIGGGGWSAQEIEERTRSLEKVINHIMNYGNTLSGVSDRKTTCEKCGNSKIYRGTSAE